MKLNIKKYAQISYIAINDSEIEDVEKGVLDILDYVAILNNIHINSNETNSNNIYENSVYRANKNFLNKESQELLLKNAPKCIDNYFIVPDLIVRKS